MNTGRFGTRPKSRHITDRTIYRKKNLYNVKRHKEEKDIHE